MTRTAWFPKLLFSNRIATRTESERGDLQKNWKIPPDVHADQHDGVTVILHRSAGRVFRCNRLGSCIWQRLSSGVTGEAIAGEMMATYGLTSQHAERDVLHFLASLKQQALILRGDKR